MNRYVALLAAVIIVGGALWYVMQNPSDDGWKRDLESVEANLEDIKDEQRASQKQAPAERAVHFSASPTSGNAPLSVWFSASLSGGVRDTGFDYFIRFDDGTLKQMEWENGKGTSDAWSLKLNRVYASGSHAATLLKGHCIPEKDCDLLELSAAKITVQAASPPSEVPSAMSPPVNPPPESPVTLDKSSLATWSMNNPIDKIISGNASGVPLLRVTVVIAGKPADDWNTAYANDHVQIVNGRWAITVPTNKLSCNAYTVSVYDVFKTLLASGEFVGTGCAVGN